MPFTKRDLVLAVSRKLDLTQNDVTDVVQCALDTMVAELAKGHSIEFRNFGVFELVPRKQRIGRNPNAPEKEFTIPQRIAVKFKPGKEMRLSVQELDVDQIKKD